MHESCRSFRIELKDWPVLLAEPGLLSTVESMAPRLMVLDPGTT